MKSSRALDRIMIVVLVFIFMFMMTVTCVPYLLKILGLSSQSRDGLLCVSILQAFFAFILPSIISAALISKTPIRWLYLKKAPGWLPIIGLIFGYLIGLPALNQIIYWNEHLVFPSSMQGFANLMRELEDQALSVTSVLLQTSSLGGLISGILVIGVLTGIAEEFFFRGTLQNALTVRGRHHLAIWITAFIFSVFHFQIFGFIPRLLLGAWFGYLIFWTGSLYVPIIAHALNNSLVVLCAWLTVKGSGIDFEMIGVATEGFPLAAAVSCGAMILFLIFFRKFFFYSTN